MRSVAAAIIAGGPARRLGGAIKPLLELGGQAVADRQLAVLRPLFPRLLVVANDPAPWRGRGVEIVADRVAGAGPLAGLSAALAAAGDAEAVVCVAGDLPFLSPALLAALRDRGYLVAVAGMTLPNPASEGFHRAMGFEPVGTYRRIGYKHGAWHDVAWTQKLLAPGGSPPDEPR